MRTHHPGHRDSHRQDWRRDLRQRPYCQSPTWGLVRRVTLGVAATAAIGVLVTAPPAHAQNTAPGPGSGTGASIPRVEFGGNVSGLLTLRLGHLKSAEAHAALAESQARIQAMATAHELLGNWWDHIDRMGLRRYVTTVATAA